MFELAWDEDEAKTRESLSSVPESPTRKWDTIVDEGPCTDRDAAPITVSSADDEGWLKNWDDGDPTYPQPRKKVDSAIVEVEEARPASIVPDAFDDMPESAVHRTGQAASLPVPLAVPAEGMPDAEDLTETTRRGVVGAPRGPLPSFQPSPFVVDERLRAEVARLRRWLRISLAVGLMALVVSVVLAVLLLSTPSGNGILSLHSAGLGAMGSEVSTRLEAMSEAPAEAASTRQGIVARSSQDGVRVFVDGEERGELPISLTDLEPGMHALRFEGGEAFATETRRLEVSPGEVTDLGEIQLVRDKVEVLVTVLSLHASVALTPIGGLPEPVGGPWPKKLYLPEGKYTLTATKRGKKPAMAMLDLSLEKPTREIVLRVR
jgi:hypothetical protein